MPSLDGLVWERERVLVNEILKFENVLKMSEKFFLKLEFREIRKLNISLDITQPQ
jgi:hypothetical protein